MSSAAQLRCEVQRLEPRALLSATLVEDLEPTPGRADATPGVTLDGVAYFPAAGPRGRELFRSDGTAKGTRLLRDILLGAPSSDPQGLTLFNDRVYFTAANHHGGRDLWLTDGTRTGTQRVRGFNAAAAGTLLRTRRALFFQVAAPEGPVSIWTSDGTSDGTTAAVAAGEAPGMTVTPDKPLTYAAGRLYFLARSGGDEAPELWSWDGSQPQRLREFPTPQSLPQPNEFEAFGGQVYFIVHDATSTRVPWRTDGTVEGTQPLDPATAPVGVETIARINSRTLLFAGNSPVLTDGTPAGTKRLDSVSSGIRSCCTHAGKLVLFSAGYEGTVWRTDGTVKGTFPLRGATGSTGFIQVGGAYYFLRDDHDKGASLWRTDGTRKGTEKIRAFPSADAHSFAGVTGDGRVLFTTHAPWPWDAPDQLWVSDGTKAGTRPLRRTYEWTVGADPQNLTTVGNDLYFAQRFQRIDAFGTPYALFRLYKREGGTGKVVKVLTARGTVREIVHSDDELYVRSSEEPWCCIPGNVIETLRVIDTAAGTAKRVFIGPSKNPQHRLMPYGDGLVLLPWRDGDSEVELGLLDGSGTGSVVKDINPDGSSFPAGFARLGDVVLFAATDEGSGRELWRTDGTEAGTRRVRDVSPGPASSYPTDITVVGKVAFFVASDEAHGRGLWKSDGSEAGTVLVKDLRDDLEDPLIGSLTVLGDQLFFVADDGVNGSELWTSDGRLEGTRLVKDVRPGPDGAAAQLTVFGDALYFAADDGVHGNELWRSDGTPEGTALVSDLVPGRRGSSPHSSFAASGRIFFAAEDARYGVELWETDGTVGGTRRLTDLFPGRASSDPTSIVEADGRLFFTADDGRHGREPWQLPL